MVPFREMVSVLFNEKKERFVPTVFFFKLICIISLLADMN